MSTPPILIVKRGSVSRADLDLVRRAGVVVVVVKDPSDVRYMHPPLAPSTRLQEVATALVRECASKGTALYQDDVRHRLAAAFLEDVQPKQAKEPT